MRVLQAAGCVNPNHIVAVHFLSIYSSSSAVMSIGAASLADIFDPTERGTKVRDCVLSVAEAYVPHRWAYITYLLF